MTQPVGYSVSTLFQQEETNAVAGRSTVRTSALDAELQNIATTLSQTLANIAVIQRDDTGLRDLVVTTESLSANVKALFAGGINPRGAWLTATAYAVKDVVETGTPFVSYVCVIAHTSGVFATDRTAGKWMVLGQEPGSIVITDLTLTTGGITLGTNNTQDLAATANRFRSGYFGTTVFAGTSVVTTLSQSPAATTYLFGSDASGGDWGVTTATKHLVPTTDNLRDLGKVGNRIHQVFTPIIDSGTTGSVFIKTNAGATQFEIQHVATSVNWVSVFGAIATGTPGFSTGQSGDTNVGMQFFTKGTGGFDFRTNGNPGQFSILHTASATRNITVTGSNGGNPTIGVTAGNLAITPAVVISGLTSVAAGTGTGLATVGGVLNINTTVVGNVGGGADSLMSYTLPANSLSSNGKGVQIVAWGKTASNANAKNLSLAWGGGTVLSKDFTVSIAGAWRIVWRVFRTGASVQIMELEITETVNDVAIAAPKESVATKTGAATDTAGIGILFTAQATADNDITQEGMIVTFLN